MHTRRTSPLPGELPAPLEQLGEARLVRLGADQHVGDHLGLGIGLGIGLGSGLGQVRLGLGQVRVRVRLGGHLVRHALDLAGAIVGAHHHHARRVVLDAVVLRVRSKTK